MSNEVKMPCDKDIEDLIASTQRAATPIAVAIERERMKLRAKLNDSPSGGVLSPSGDKPS